MRKLIIYLVVTCFALFAGYQVVKAWETSGGLEVIRGEILGGNLNANNKEITNLKALTFYAASELTVAAGAITVTQAVHTVDGASDLDDDLVTISGGNDEELLLLRPENAARNITLKHGTGNIIMGNAADYIIPDNGMVLLQYDGSNWRLVSGGGDLVDDLTPQLGADLDLNTHEITVKEYISIPIEWALDGSSAPDAVSVLTSTFSVPVREFQGGTGHQDVYVPWTAPKDLTTGVVSFRVRGWTTNGTAPATGETIIFTLAGSSVGDSELLSKAVGSAVSSTFTADGTYAQYDRWSTAWSGDVTVTDLAADEDVMFQLIRDQGTDTYGQKAGAAWLDIEYFRAITND